MRSSSAWRGGQRSEGPEIRVRSWSIHKQSTAGRLRSASGEFFQGLENSSIEISKHWKSSDSLFGSVPEISSARSLMPSSSVSAFFGSLTWPVSRTGLRRRPCSTKPPPPHSEGTGVQLTINGSYVQNVTGSGVIPVATWGAASTCRINSTFTSNIDAGANDVQLNYGQAFGNFIWNAQGGTTNVVYRMTKSTAHQLDRRQSDHLKHGWHAGPPGIGGDAALERQCPNLTMTGGNFRAGGGGSALTVNGPMAISAGMFDTGGTITALDNVSITGTADVIGNAAISFAKAGAQSWTVTTTNDVDGSGVDCEQRHRVDLGQRLSLHRQRPDGQWHPGGQRQLDVVGQRRRQPQHQQLLARSLWPAEARWVATAQLAPM